MLPTFTQYTRSYPKLFALCSITLFILVALLWVHVQKGSSVAVPTVPDTSATQLEAQKKLLIAPDTTNTEAVATYTTAVAANSVESDTIVVNTACVMSPLIIKMKEGAQLTIENRDTTEHVLAFEDQNFFAVSGGQVRTINITDVFGKGAGIYRYRCGDISKEQNVGIMYVVQ
jgi:plastocyanin